MRAGVALLALAVLMLFVLDRAHRLAGDAGRRAAAAVAGDRAGQEALVHRR